MAHPPLSVWLLAIRPKTLPAAIAPVIIGTGMAFADGAFHWLSAFAALLGALFIQIGTNFTNDYSDHARGTDTADRLGPVRVTQAGLVPAETMKRATIVVFAAAFLIGLYLVSRGGWPVVMIGVCSVLFGVLYTAGPYPLGYNGLGDVFVLIFFGPVAVGGTYYVQALQITWPVILAGFSPGLMSVGVLTVNNLRDIDGDRKAGKRTLAARFGRAFARIEYLSSLLIAAGLPVVLFFTVRQSGYLLLVLIMPIMAIPTIRTVFTQTDGPSLNSALAGTGRLLILYALLFSVGWVL